MDQIPEVLDRLQITYTTSKNRYFFPCPVHGGDNKSGCTIFADDKLCWKCWTHGCHNEYGSGIFGFVRGSLTRAKKKNISYDEVVDFFGAQYLVDTTPEFRPYEAYLDMMAEFQKTPNRLYQYSIDREYAIRNLIIPSPYFIGRKNGFSEAALIKFDIGDCLDDGAFMFGRACSPIYNEDYKFVGMAGRSMDDSAPKWKYDSIIEKGQHLYGLNLAMDAIRDSGVVILVEGQGNVWRLWEAGYFNSVGIMGSALTEFQLILLEMSGCTTVVIMTDMDSAGRKAVSQIKAMCGRRFNYIVPEMIYNDPADHMAGELQELLKGII